MKSKITGNIHLGGQDFEYEVYFPRVSQDANEKEEIIKRLGSRIKNGAACLGLDENLARKHIANNEYVAVGFVTNKHHDDAASGTLQYFDWCDHKKRVEERRGKQIWINDLCRITNGKKPDQSPVKILFRVFEKTVTDFLHLTLRHVYLMVKTDLLPPLISDGAKVLIKIYEKYGFSVVRPSECHVQDKYIIMRKGISRRVVGGGKKRTMRKKVGTKRNRTTIRKRTFI